MVKLPNIDPTNRRDVQRALTEYFMVDGNYTIDDNGLVSVVGNVTLMVDLFDQLPIAFKEVTGDFSASRCQLNSLAGSPFKVGKSFDCSRNRLTSLEGSLKVVKEFYCQHNHITDFKGCPDATFVDATSCPIKSFDGLPNSVSGMSISLSDDLPVLRLLKFDQLGFTHSSGKHNTHALSKIIRKYNKGKETTRSDILACQRELIANGFEKNARW